MKHPITLNKENHRYETPEGIIVPSYSAIISECAFTDWSKIPEFYRNRACDLGSAVHALTEYYDRILPTTVMSLLEEYSNSLQKWLLDKYQLETNLMKYLLQWMDFRKEYKIHKFDYIEQAFYAKEHFYACTIDRCWGSNLLDVKTGNSYNTHQLQTAAQALAMSENDVVVKKRFNVYLKEDSYEVVEHKNLGDVDDFITCLEYYHLKKRLTKE